MSGLKPGPVPRCFADGVGTGEGKNRSRFPSGMTTKEEQKQIPFGNDNKQEQKQIPFGNDNKEQSRFPSGTTTKKYRSRFPSGMTTNKNRSRFPSGMTTKKNRSRFPSGMTTMTEAPLHHLLRCSESKSEGVAGFADLAWPEEMQVPRLRPARSRRTSLGMTMFVVELRSG